MLRGLLVIVVFGLVGCLGPDADPAVTSKEDAQSADYVCKLEGTVCASLVARELVGTPQLLRAYLVQRVRGHTDMWQIAHIENPDIEAGAIYVLPFQNFAHEGRHFLSIRLSVSTCPRDCATSKLEQGGPVWTDEAIEHIEAEDIDTPRAVRRTTSWFAAQNARRTSAQAVHRGLERLEESAIEVPLLSDRYDLEYEGWAGPFDLNGEPVNIGLIELMPCADDARDKTPAITVP
jgi:hypothetical protein